jgi:pimeloyl-CoA synthetase
LNLEDRVDYLIKKLETLFSVSPNSLKKKSDSFSKKLNLNIKEGKDGEFKDIKNLPTFTITINNINEIREIITNELNKEGFTYDKKKNSWTVIVG